MRKLTPGVLLISLLLVTGSLTAQTGVRIGFRGGYSLATQYGVNIPDIPYSVKTMYRHGFAGGLVIAYPITEDLYIHQEFLYVQKGSREDIRMIDLPVRTETVYDLNYFEIPIAFRYVWLKLGKLRLYSSAGFALSIMLNGNYQLDGVHEVGGETTDFSIESDMEGVDIFDYAFLYGLGVEFSLGGLDWFFGYRFTIGWHVLEMPTYEGEDPAPLRNQDYIFTLGCYLNKLGGKK